MSDTRAMIDTNDILQPVFRSIPLWFWLLIAIVITVKIVVGTAPRNSRGKARTSHGNPLVMPLAVFIVLGLFWLKSKLGFLPIATILPYVIGLGMFLVLIACIAAICSKKRKIGNASLTTAKPADSPMNSASTRNLEPTIASLENGDDWLLPHSKAERRGEIGEWQMLQVLRHFLPLDGDDGYRIMHNVMLEDDKGVTTQIDFIVVSKYGVLVIEVKFFKAWIFAKPSSAQWVATYPNGEKCRFQNPLRQNFRHICVIAGKTGIDRNLLIPIVAFGPESDFKTEMPQGVMHFSGVPSYIRSFSKAVIKPEQLDEIVKVFKEWDNDIDCDKKIAHSENLRKIHGGFQ